MAASPRCLRWPERRCQLLESQRFLHFVKLIDRGTCQTLFLPGRPADFHPIDSCCGSQSKVQPAFILRTEAAPAGDLLQLLLSCPEDADFRADRAPVAAPALEIEFNPVPSRRDRVLV